MRSEIENLKNIPVIIGSSLTGLLISMTLSREGINHVLIGGDPPDDVPRLGESLNECAGPALWREFGKEVQDCFFIKSHISLMNGRFLSMIYLANPNRSVCAGSHLIESKFNQYPSLWKLLVSALFKGTTILHLDRIRFDPMVYHKAIAKKECRFINGMVDKVEMSSDRITSLQLKDGRKIDSPSFVYDAVGFRSPVAAAASVETIPLSNRQRVVFAHYQTLDGAACDKRLWWMKGTNLLRLDQENDSIEGISWLIPLGDTLSVGISVDDEKFGKDTLDKFDLMAKLDVAWKRRGVDYRELFPRHERATPEIVHRYYRRDRSTGANWHLPGGSYISIWFPSSAGLWTTLAAVRLAPEFLSDPENAGKKYEAILTKSLTGFHSHLEGMIHGPVFKQRSHPFRFWGKWLAAVPLRFSDYLALESNHRWHPLLRPLKAIGQIMTETIAFQFVYMFVRKREKINLLGEQPHNYFNRPAFQLRNLCYGPWQYWKRDRQK